MSEVIDLKKLSQYNTQGRGITTLYMRSPRSMDRYERRSKSLSKLLKEHPEELAAFRANDDKLTAYFEENPYTSGGLFIICSAELDVLVPLSFDLPEDRLPSEDGLWFDTTAYIRPVAEMQDEFEQHVVIVATNHSASVQLVTVGKHEEVEAILGEIKNSVKKGGWSQQRYARRRVKQLSDYASEIGEAIERLERRTSFARIFLLGSKEIIQELEEKLPRRLRNKVEGVKAVPSKQSAVQLEEIAAELFKLAEASQEQDIWEEIRAEAMQQGRALLGAMDVHVALQQGRVHTLLLQRDSRLDGTRCKVCGHVSLGVRELCMMCGESDPLTIDMVNEFVELAAKAGTQIEFSDPHEELTEVEGVAALLRY